MEKKVRKRRRFETILVLFSTIRLLPHIVLFNIHPQKSVIEYDVQRWMEWKSFATETSTQYGFIYFMTFCPEFRNIFYMRVGIINRIIGWLCPRMSTLFIYTKNIGPGLIIQHGFSTIITAKSIGKNCRINQQVTIGFSGNYNPIIGDNVLVTAGAKVLGNVVVGNNVKIGANAVVVKDVPENCTVVGVPAYIVKRNGIKVKENL